MENKFHMFWILKQEETYRKSAIDKITKTTGYGKSVSLQVLSQQVGLSYSSTQTLVKNKVSSVQSLSLLASFYNTREKVSLMRDRFLGRLIYRLGDFQWSARSPDLSHLHLFPGVT